MKPSKTLADYVTVALSPALIMALVGSLVFFLLEVLYVGQYSERLQWTLFPDARGLAAEGPSSHAQT